MLGNGVMEQEHGRCPSATEAGHAERDVPLYLVKYQRCRGDGVSKEMEEIVVQYCQ